MTVVSTSLLALLVAFICFLSYGWGDVSVTKKEDLKPDEFDFFGHPFEKSGRVSGNHPVKSVETSTTTISGKKNSPKTLSKPDDFDFFDTPFEKSERVSGNHPAKSVETSTMTISGPKTLSKSSSMLFKSSTEAPEHKHSNIQTNSNDKLPVIQNSSTTPQDKLLDVIIIEIDKKDDDKKMGVYEDKQKSDILVKKDKTVVLTKTIRTRIVENVFEDLFNQNVRRTITEDREEKLNWVRGTDVEEVESDSDVESDVESLFKTASNKR